MTTLSHDQVADDAEQHLVSKGKIPDRSKFALTTSDKRFKIMRETPCGDYRLASFVATVDEKNKTKNEEWHYFGPYENHLAFLGERESNAWIAWGYRNREDSTDYVFLVSLAEYSDSEWGKHITPSYDEKKNMPWDSVRIFSKIDPDTGERCFRLRKDQDDPGKDLKDYLIWQDPPPTPSTNF